MKLKKEKHKYTKLALYAIPIVLLLLTVCYFININNNDNNNVVDSINYKEPSKAQIENGASIKKDSNESSPDTSTEITITALNQTQLNLQIRVQINKVENEGQCTLSIYESGNILLQKKSDIQSLASITTCKGFDVALSDIPKGNLTITMEYSNALYKTSISKDVVIK